MSSLEQIFLHTGLAPDQAAERLAQAIGGTLDRDEEGDVYVTRPVAGQQGTVGGQVDRNHYGDDTPEPGEESVYDRYDTVYEIWSSTRDEELQRAEAAKLFRDITTQLPWPAVLTYDFGALISASAPKIGRVDFPPGATPDAAHRQQWAPYAFPAAPHSDPGTGAGQSHTTR